MIRKVIQVLLLITHVSCIDMFFINAQTFCRKMEDSDCSWFCSRSLFSSSLTLRKDFTKQVRQSTNYCKNYHSKTRKTINTYVSMYVCMYSEVKTFNWRLVQTSSLPFNLSWSWHSWFSDSDCRVALKLSWPSSSFIFSCWLL